MLAVALAALALPASALAGLRVKEVSSAAYPTIRLAVVMPTDSAAEPSVTENGRPVQGFSAHRLGAKSIVLAVDQSRSMRGRPLAQAAAAARRFVAAKSQEDRIALVSFGRTALQLTSFSTATIDADSGLRTLAADWQQGTALYDAVVLSATALASEPPEARILILLTDGRDVSSSASLSDAIAAARRAKVAVYPIGIEGFQYTPVPLVRLAQATGGTYYVAPSASRLAGIYNRIAVELRRTWLLDYATAARPGDLLRLRVSAPGSGSATAAYTVPAGLGPPAHKAKSGGFRSHWWGAAVLGALIGAVIFFGVRTAFAASRRVHLRSRLEPYVGPEAEAKKARAEKERLAVLSPLFRATEGALAELRIWQKLELQLVRGAVPLRTVELVYLMAGCGLLLGLVAGVGGLPPILIVFFAAVGISIPYLVVAIKAKRRLSAFEQQLPAALNTLAASLKAGHSFTQAVQGLVDGGGAPVATEFRRVLAEARLGHPMHAALAGMGERVGSRELDFLLRAVVIQRQVGGSLAGLFELVAETVSRRQQFRQKIKSLTAMGRMSASILIALPLFVGLMLTAVNKDYMDPLYSTHPGHVILAIALSMMFVGTVVLRQMVRFKG